MQFGGGAPAPLSVGRVGIEPTTNGLKVPAGVGWVVPGAAAASRNDWSEGVLGAARSGRERAVPERPLTHRSRMDGVAACSTPTPTGRIRGPIRRTPDPRRRSGTSGGLGEAVDPAGVVPLENRHAGQATGDRAVWQGVRAERTVRTREEYGM